MKKLLAILFLLIAITLLLMNSTVCWANGEEKTPGEFSLQIAPESTERVLYVPKGYSVPADGYYMPEKTGREILTAWKTEQERAAFYENKINELLASQEAFIVSVEKKIADISEKAANALEMKDRQIREERRKARRPGIGVFAGAGYSSDGKVNGVIGFGVVWKIW